MLLNNQDLPSLDHIIRKSEGLDPVFDVGSVLYCDGAYNRKLNIFDKTSRGILKEIS